MAKGSSNDEMSTLKIENLHVSVAGTPILKGVNLEINSGEIHADRKSVV